MGTPNPNNEEGTACGICWGLGKKFGALKTPKYIEVTFIGIEPGYYSTLVNKPSVNRIFRLAPVGACMWTYNDGFFVVNLHFFSSYTVLEGYTYGYYHFFNHPNAARCAVEFQSILTGYYNWYGTGGVGLIHWNYTEPL